MMKGQQSSIARRLIALRMPKVSALMLSLTKELAVVLHALPV